MTDTRSSPAKSDEHRPSAGSESDTGKTGTKRKAESKTTGESSPKSQKLEKKTQQTLDDHVVAASEAKEHGSPNKSEQTNPADDNREPTQKEQPESQGDTTAVDHDNGREQEQEKKSGIQEDPKRKKAVPSSVLEKGIIHFFVRGRVDVEDPHKVQDLARTYFVLRPLPLGTKLSDGAIPDLKNNRLIALPKKVWPKSSKDRFMAFVEKAKVDMPTLKEEFFSGSEYSTKTTGQRHVPDITPVGEGVYAIVKTGGGQGTSHLLYMLTIPSEPSEVQRDLGLADKGSFVLSMKNPRSSGPANAQLPESADYPEEIFEEFGSRSWMPASPKHLDYANAQMLLIHEDFESDKLSGPSGKDGKSEKETPREELETMEDEDEHRVAHLHGDDAIFADLGISSKEYPSVLTTW